MHLWKYTCMRVCVLKCGCTADILYIRIFSIHSSIIQQDDVDCALRKSESRCKCEQLCQQEEFQINLVDVCARINIEDVGAECVDYAIRTYIHTKEKINVLHCLLCSARGLSIGVSCSSVVCTDLGHRLKIKIFHM